MMGLVLAVWRVLVDVAAFWHKVNDTSSLVLPHGGDRDSSVFLSILLTPFQKLLSWYTRKNPVTLWLELLRNAETFEDWEEAALHLDNLLGLDLWYVSDHHADNGDSYLLALDMRC
jgi:TAG lipase/lysophosphatidylethanolamine acyltransferase